MAHVDYNSNHGLRVLNKYQTLCRYYMDEGGENVLL